jgi:hypothetical protein
MRSSGSFFKIRGKIINPSTDSLVNACNYTSEEITQGFFSLLLILVDRYRFVFQLCMEHLVYKFSQLFLTNCFTKQMVAMSDMLIVQQHLCISKAQFLPAGIAAFTVPCTISDLPFFYVSWDILKIRFDVNSIPANDPL